MEEQKEIRKDYLIVRDGRFFKVLHSTRWIGGMFTTEGKAQQYIDAVKVNEEQRQFDAELKDIRKETDVNKKMKRYKKLCQTKSSA